jgi:hypothetical protein
VPHQAGQVVGVTKLVDLAASGGQRRQPRLSSILETLENDMVDSTALAGLPECTAAHSRPDDRPVVLVQASEISPDRRRGGEIRTLLSPRNADSVSGFSGVAVPGLPSPAAEHGVKYIGQGPFRVGAQRPRPPCHEAVRADKDGPV